MPRRRDEPVRLTRIYTRGGDAGETSLGDGSRVSKLDPLIRGYGAVDELNSLIGWVLVAAPDERLVRVQNELFDLGADIATPAEDFSPTEMALRIIQPQIDRLESEIDRMNESLTPLRSFILPGGGAGAAHLHLARAIVRRAERSTVAASRHVPLNPLARIYLNRLSDHLFVLARSLAAKQDGDVLWQPGGTRT